MPANVTSKFSGGGLLNTLNPFSAFFSFGANGKQYVPEWLINAFKGGDWGDLHAKQAAQLTAKVITGGAIFGLGALAVRSLMHTAKIDNIEDMNASATAGHKLKGMYRKPTGSMLQYTEQDEEARKKLNPAESDSQQGVQKKAGWLFDDGGVVNGIIPPAVALLAAVATFKATDKMYDTALSKKLNKDIARAEKQRDELAHARILKGRGIQKALQDKEEEQKQAQAKVVQKLQKAASLIKESSLFGDNTSAIVGALGLLLFGTGFAGGMMLHNNMDKDIVKYKAHKKGLETYTKARLMQQPVVHKPLDPQMLALLNSNLDKPKSKKSSKTQQRPAKGSSFSDLLI